MHAIALSEANTQLTTILGRLLPGEAVTLTDNDRPVATLTKNAEPTPVRQAGCYKQVNFAMAADFDAPLDEFEGELP